MYAEIKSNNSMFINRLDDSEKILLKNIVEEAANKKVILRELIDETGDFGGCFIELEDLPEESNTEPSIEPED